LKDKRGGSGTGAMEMEKAGLRGGRTALFTVSSQAPEGLLEKRSRLRDQSPFITMGRWSSTAGEV